MSAATAVRIWTFEVFTKQKVFLISNVIFPKADREGNGMRKKLLVLLILSATTTIHADPLKDIAKCAAKDADGERLICYDELAEKLNVSKPKVTMNETKGKWESVEKRSPVDDSLNVTLFLDASEEIEGRLSIQKVTPYLVIRCSENKTSAYIKWDRYLGIGDTSVLTRIDKNKAQTRRWDLSTDNEATFAPKAIGFIKSLFDHDKLLAQVTPYGDSPVRTSFEIAGLKESIKPLRAACNW